MSPLIGQTPSRLEPGAPRGCGLSTSDTRRGAAHPVGRPPSCAVHGVLPPGSRSTHPARRVPERFAGRALALRPRFSTGLPFPRRDDGGLRPPPRTKHFGLVPDKDIGRQARQLEACLKSIFLDPKNLRRRVTIATKAISGEPVSDTTRTASA